MLVVLKPVPDPDLEIRGMGRGGAVIQTLRLEGGGAQVPNFFFQPFGPHIALKLREGKQGGFATENNTLWTELPFVVSLIKVWGEKEALSAWIVSSLESRRSPNFWTSQSRFLSSNWFLECEHLFIDKPMVTDPTVLSARVLVPDLKLYPSSMHCMSNKDLRERSQKLVGWGGWGEGADEKLSTIWNIWRTPTCCIKHFQGPPFSIPKIWVWDTPNQPHSPNFFLVPVSLRKQPFL